MANYSDETRKDQVLHYLTDHAGEWVDGPELANEMIGGSEGLKRVRELRSEGHLIQTRKHPDPGRDIFQYRLLVRVKQTDPEYVPPIRVADAPVRTYKIPVDDAGRYTEFPRGLAFGDAAICHRCKGQTRRIAKAPQNIALFRDPDDGKIFCTGCNGWGIVPVAAAS